MYFSWGRMCSLTAECFVLVHTRPLLCLLWEAALNESDFCWVLFSKKSLWIAASQLNVILLVTRHAAVWMQRRIQVRGLCWRGKRIPPSYLFIVTGAVIVQVLLAERAWHHLQGSVKSLTHFVPCVFEGLSHAVASLPENTSSEIFFLRAFFLVVLFFVLMVTFLTHRQTSSTGGPGSCGMTTTNKGNKALKVIDILKSAS